MLVSPAGALDLYMRSGRPEIIAQTRTPRGLPAGRLLQTSPARAGCANGSGAASPQSAIPAQNERQVVLVARPLLVFRQLGLLLDSVPALALARGDLHGLGSVAQEGELILDVLLGAEAVARSGVARD